MPGYDIAKEVKDVAEELIGHFYPKLAGLNIQYLFRDEAAVSNGKVTVAMACRVDDRNWALSHVDFIIEVAKDVWNAAEPRFRRAVIDHELQHIGLHCDEQGAIKKDAKTNRVKGYIRKHDMEEFEAVVSRHGSYRGDLRSFLDAYAKGRTQAKVKVEATAGAAADLE